jgi:hypothetical protein
MKMNKKFAPLAALLTLMFSSQASAVMIDFIDLTQGPGNLGESAWTTLTIPGAFGLSITGHATNDNVGDTDQFAYLDWGNAGLGVCKDATLVDPVTSTGGTNRCSPSSDDNVTVGEYLEFVFTQDVVVENLWFNNNHDGGFAAPDAVSINGGSYAVATGYAGGVNGIGAFSLLAGEILKIAYDNEEFYVSGMEVSAVPVPAAVWLFGSALLGFVGLSRRTNIA